MDGVLFPTSVLHAGDESHCQTRQKAIDVHLMIVEPDRYIDAFHDGSRRIDRAL